jgi:hypothetical protein
MYAMKSFGGVQVKLHIIVTSALDGCECSVNASTDIIHVGEVPLDIRRENEWVL